MCMMMYGVYTFAVAATLQDAQTRLSANYINLYYKTYVSSTSSSSSSSSSSWSSSSFCTPEVFRILILIDVMFHEITRHRKNTFKKHIYTYKQVYTTRKFKNSVTKGEYRIILRPKEASLRRSVNSSIVLICKVHLTPGRVDSIDSVGEGDEVDVELFDGSDGCCSEVCLFT
ncbi:hypothetical protein HELRODRAFT_184256 [Helobdella robusta]|uniref:Uncharacterized protein n=1 Tax=Helobdella robusta TaxID=6412 RepID=T1FKV2_HELRO|nr:hypothetical protein HELRODRAFT_184256 [Helobdella robusta]ESO04132.1 hypothetical protein HELRODRAFT_184256 [Helobdella robusta]